MPPPITQPVPTPQRGTGTPPLPPAAPIRREPPKPLHMPQRPQQPRGKPS